MSYSLGTGVIPATEVRASLERAAEQNTTLTDEARTAVEAGIQAAEHLRDVVGGTHVSVWISGHANPGHSAPAGWSRDQVQVSVSQAPEPAAGSW